MSEDELIKWVMEERKAEMLREIAEIKNKFENDDLARFAVDEHNKKQNAVLEFHKVVNVEEQVVLGIVKYITLVASDARQKKVYEAKVWVRRRLNFKELQEFKHIGDA